MTQLYQGTCIEIAKRARSYKVTKCMGTPCQLMFFAKDLSEFLGTNLQVKFLNLTILLK